MNREELEKFIKEYEQTGKSALDKVEAKDGGVVMMFSVDFISFICNKISKLAITEEEIDSLKEALSSELSILLTIDVRNSSVLKEYHQKVAIGLQSLLTKLKRIA